MQWRLINRNRRELITSILLVALAFRALIPVGFMPATEKPFSLEICHAGFLAHLGPHGLGQHPDSQSNFDHCPFGSAPATGPISQTTALLLPSWLIASASAVDFEPLRLGVRHDRAHPPRGPPVKV